MTFNLWTFLFEAINFVVLAYVLHWLLYRPLRQAIDERRRSNELARTEADKAREEAIALQAEFQRQVRELEQKSQEIIRLAREQAETERRKLLSEAKQKMQLHQEEGRLLLQRERTEVLQSLRSELVTLSVELTERMLREACDSSLQRQLCHRLVQTLNQFPEDQRAALRHGWHAEDGVVVETALGLDHSSLAEITEAVTAILGQKVDPVVQTKPALLAGLRLRVGGQVWDASVAGQLEAARTPVEEKQYV